MASFDDFSAAFFSARPILAAFASCHTLEELRVVRDMWYIALGSELDPVSYNGVKQSIVGSSSVAELAKSPAKYQAIVQAARSGFGLNGMIDSVCKIASTNGTNLQEMWEGLERGRMTWLMASSRAHNMKVLLRDAVIKDGDTDGDRSDAMMIWIYALALNLPNLKEFAEKWASAVEMEDPTQPLLGHVTQKWDPRRPEWRALDVGAQDAAEKAGSTLLTEWYK